jgi:hypothetical protein
MLFFGFEKKKKLQNDTVFRMFAAGAEQSRDAKKL